MHSEITRLAGFIGELVLRLCISSAVVGVFSLLNIGLALSGSYTWKVALLTMAGYAAIGFRHQWEKKGAW